MAATVDDDDLEWSATGFNLVSLNWTAGHDKVITHGSWGIPPGLFKHQMPHDQFSLARIGDNLRALGYAQPPSWNDKIEHPVELVRVKLAGNALGAIRQIVDE
ncbi:hypothetical protein B0H67DRAFT_640844 [Lasiosphaeris hirsuta]|uniref:Uncharacterized protein n=1 Tax=Lasiosphaeris hirsuta TaxID=260670 RepID=A0AA40AYE9_9PEZI|nr:hypothetical protein B0H67DRAFT_640844 [Lasiosphaeris hirsuta]